MSNNKNGSDSLRILLTTPDYQSTGGIQTLTQNLELGLEELGHTVEVVHVDQDTSYSLSHIIPRFRWNTSFRDLMTGRWVYRAAVYSAVEDAVAEFDPDIIHTLHVEHYPALIAAQETDIPSVLSTHALELQNEEVAATAFEKADRIHTVSNFTTSLVREIADTHSSVEDISQIVYRMPPSIDVETYRSRRKDDSKGLPPDDAPVLTLSRLEEGYKNIETVIHAWKRLPAAVTSGRELVVAGDGPQRPSLEERAKSATNVSFLGYVDEQRKRQLLAEAAVFAFVPRREGYGAEGFGIVFIEAQASGTPVVGSNNGGAPEAVGDGGIVVENESDPEEVADAIRTLLTDADARREYLSAAAERIDQFDVPAVAKEHAEQYRRMLSAR